MIDLYSDIISRYEKVLPSVLLIKGPEGIGKKSLAFKLAEQVASKSNTYFLDNPSVEEVRRLRKLLQGKVTGDFYRVVIINMLKVSPQVCESLLKILEELIDSARFLLISERDLPQTIFSRSFVLPLATLSEEKIFEVLLDEGISENTARETAKISGGNILKAKALLAGDEIRNSFLVCLRAIVSGNLLLFSRTLLQLKEMKEDLLYCFLEDLSFYSKTGKTLGFFSAQELRPFLDSFSRKMKEVEKILMSRAVPDLRLLTLGLELGSFKGVA